MVRQLENLVFAHRGAVLLAFALLTLVTAGYARRVRIDTSFDSHLPIGHPYINTFLHYRDQMTGVNRVILALHTDEDSIWTPAYMRKLHEATNALFFLPGIDRRTVTSLWTPNITYVEITEDGMRSEDMIGANVTPDNITQADVDRIRDRVLRSGLVGRLVSNDFTSAMVVAEAVDVDVSGGGQPGVLELAKRLERVRRKLSGDGYDVYLIGFVTMIGDIANGARDVIVYFLVAFLLTAAAVYAYSRSWILTMLPLACSLVSGIWQFGAMDRLGYRVDPIAILVPFLVFAIGVSHGIQQINLIARRVVAGDDALTAARRSFRELLVPGSMALITDLTAFATLTLVPIPVVRDLGVTASIGVAFKVVSTLVLLPVAASYFHFDSGFTARSRRSQDLAARILRRVGRIAERRNAWVALGLLAVLFGASVWEGRGRHVGDLHAGATELRPDSRYNRDAQAIVEHFDFGLDVLTVFGEAPRGSCIDYGVIRYLDDFSWHMENVPGVQSVMSISIITRVINAAWNEGNLAWRAIPRNRYSLMQVTSSIPSGVGVYNEDCSLMPVQVFTRDHRADTIRQVVAGALGFIDGQPNEKVTLRMASGNIGVQAATNQTLQTAELPMMLYAYAAIVALVLLTYRDWRAAFCCCVPLLMATFLGYWFMKELRIGLKVSTLPVMVLAVGIGVDYAFYIYSRMRRHMEEGAELSAAYLRALVETGNAVAFTGITLAIGVSTWAFSPLQFQADMGLLLAFMFMTNMVMAVIALPAVAVALDAIEPWPRSRAG